jgi:hypothetical protein
MATDDFNRSNESLDASANWTERKGDWEVISNEAGMPTTSANQSVAKFDNSGLSSADYYIQALVIPPTDTDAAFSGIVARQADYSTDGSDGYFGWLRASINTVYLYKVVSEGFTLLDSGAVTIDSGGHTVYLEVNGTSITLKVDGTTYATATDSSISAKGNGGLSVNNASTTYRWDDYEQDSLGVAASILPFMMSYN